MRKVARYAFDAKVEATADPDGIWVQVCQGIEGWLDSKGQRADQDGTMKVTYQDGRVADLHVITTDLDNKAMRLWSLDEPSNGTVFATTIQVARDEKVIAVACELAAGAPAQVIAPVSFDAHCPRVLRDIIALDAPWSVLDVSLTTKPMRFDGAEGGENLAALISNESRTLPLVVVSEYERFVLHPNIAEDIAHDLSGLAIVAVASDSAAWGVTNALGTAWSCYNGAIRLYWPLHAVSHTPYRHPLWTARRLLHEVSGTAEAAHRIRTQFRRRILGLSTLTIRPHPVFDEVAQAHRTRLLEERRRDTTTNQEWIDYLEEQNTELEASNKDLHERIARLQTDLANAQAMLEWAPKESKDEVAPDADVPPETVTEAVERAKWIYDGLVVFGDDVATGMTRLADNAGPPDKILGYLGGLAKLAEARRKGALGASVVQWLKDRGYTASGESDTIKNNKTEMQKRTWHDGSAQREFDLHLKPSDATSPDRCVRIYFDWSDTTKAVVVGWVGRHP
jgi:cell division protein FtsB